GLRRCRGGIRPGIGSDGKARERIEGQYHCMASRVPSRTARDPVTATRRLVERPLRGCWSWHVAQSLMLIYDCSELAGSHDPDYLVEAMLRGITRCEKNEAPVAQHE